MFNLLKNKPTIVSVKDGYAIRVAKGGVLDNIPRYAELNNPKLWHNGGYKFDRYCFTKDREEVEAALARMQG